MHCRFDALPLVHAGPVQDMRKLAYTWPVFEPYAGRLPLVKPGGDPRCERRRPGAGTAPGPGTGHPAIALPAPCVTLSVCQTCAEPAP
jgi:hypothetical protein